LIGVFVSEHEPEKMPRPLLAEGVGMLLSLLDAGELEHRRYAIVTRLRRLHDSEDFASLPEDLRERIREIIGDSAH
jgi:hypothetical protein